MGRFDEQAATACLAKWNCRKPFEDGRFRGRVEQFRRRVKRSSDSGPRRAPPGRAGGSVNTGVASGLSRRRCRCEHAVRQASARRSVALMLAAVLYLGSGMAPAAWIAVRAHLPGREPAARICGRTGNWIAAAIAAAALPARPTDEGSVHAATILPFTAAHLEAVLTRSSRGRSSARMVTGVYSRHGAIIAGGVLLSADAAPRGEGLGGASS